MSRASTRKSIWESGGGEFGTRPACNACCAGGGLVGGSLLPFCDVVVVCRLVASAGAGSGAGSRVASSASAAVGSGLVGARRDHGDVEVEDKDEAPLPGAP